MNIHAHARNALVTSWIQQTIIVPILRFKYSKPVTDDLRCNNTNISLTKE